MLSGSNRTTFAIMLAASFATPAMATTRAVDPSSNDTATVQNAINASVAGDVVLFHPGSYRLAGVTLKSGVTMQGSRGVVLYDTSATVPVFRTNPSDSHDITIQNLSFVGTGADVSHGVIELFGDNATSLKGATRIAVLDSTFQNNGIRYVILKGSRISGNTISNIGAGGSAIFGYYSDAVTISNNTITNAWQGMSLINSGPNQGRNLVVAYNTGTGISRMGIEMQGQGGTNETTNLLVQGNCFTNWVKPVADGNTIAYSIVSIGTGTQILDNYAQGNVKTGVGIEIGAPGGVASRNYIDGFVGSLIGYKAGIVISYNNVINDTLGFGGAISTFGRTDETVVGNTADVTLPIPFGNLH